MTSLQLPMFITVLLVSAGVYLLCGFGFALLFAWAGAGKIDPHAKQGTWGFRLLILPGATLLWPILARRWARGISQPPQERTAHRLILEAAPATFRPIQPTAPPH